MGERIRLKIEDQFDTGYERPEYHFSGPNGSGSGKGSGPRGNMPPKGAFGPSPFILVAALLFMLFLMLIAAAAKGDDTPNRRTVEGSVAHRRFAGE